MTDFELRLECLRLAVSSGVFAAGLIETAENFYNFAKPKQRNKSMTKKHPGFKSVAKSIAKKEGVSKEAAGAILANATRKVSPKAKGANPALKKVKPAKKGK